MLRRFTIIGCLLAAFALLLAGCGAGPQTDSNGNVSGRALLWHSWNEAEAAVLSQIIERFMEINPDATVMIQGFDSVEEMLREFETNAPAGLGPDLMFAPSDAVRSLVDQGLLRPIDQAMADTEMERYLRGAVESMTVNDRLYGLPISLSTTVLYYNKRLVDSPPETLSDLIGEADAGRFVAMPDDFSNTFWGIQAFGGELFDEDGRVILDRGGFANWLAWLKTARDLPGILLDSDITVLQESFLEGDAAYYIGSSQDLQTFEAGLGEDALGVVPLPSGPIGPAGPLLGVEGLLFSSASSEGQAELALALAKFVTNPEQSALLMREVQRIPASQSLNINPSLMPVMNNLAIQSRNSVALPNTGEVDTLLEMVSAIYDRVLEGLIDPAAAATDVTATANQWLGLEEAAASPSACRAIGVVRIANLLPAEQAKIIDDRLQAYQDECPNVIVRNFTVESADLDAVMAAPANDPSYPDMIIAAQTDVASLVSEGALRRVGGLLTADELQRFYPKALEAMSYEDGIYGFPLFSDMNVLYYNRELVSDPAVNLVDLETQATGGVPITLEASFGNGFWGFGSFGGVITPDGSLTEENREALIAWLTWLRDMRDQGMVEVVDDHDLAQQRFVTGETAYFVGKASEYESLKAEVDTDLLGVSPLPSGPGGAASPILLTSGITINSGSTDEQAALAAEVARFLSNQETAEYIAEVSDVVPANATIELSKYPELARFAQQVSAAAVLPNTPALSDLVMSLDGLFSAVLTDGVPPEDAVNEVFQQIADARGLELELPAPAVVDESAE